MSSKENAGIEAQPVTEFKIPQQFANIRHNVSLLQYKYWVLMLHAYREQYEAGKRFDSREFCYLSMKDLSRWLGYKPRSSAVEEDIRWLRLQSIYYNVLEKDGHDAAQGQGYVSQYHVSSNRIGVIFPPEVRRTIEELDKPESIFHMLDWSVFNSFSRKFDAVLYKLCKDYECIGGTKSFSVERYREYMGIDREEYENPSEFKRRCILEPAKRINESEFSDIRIEPEFALYDRKLEAIRFKIAPKRKTAPELADEQAFRFAKVEITPAQQRQYLAGKDPQIVEFSILKANEFVEFMEKKGEAVDLPKLYAKAISEDWGVDYKRKMEKRTERIS